MITTEHSAQTRWVNTQRAPTMGVWEFLAATTCMLVNLLDGFDILIMSVAAPSIGADLDLSTAQIGMMFSAGLAGMMVGALSLAPLSDRYGRRRLIIACLTVNIVGMFSTGLAHNLTELVIFRFITGLGVGGMMPTVNTAIAEVVHERRRNLAVIIQCAAYPTGGLLAALLWPALIQDYGWHLIIQGACIPSIVCLGFVLLFLPETIPFLMSSRPANALQRINQTLRRYGQPTLDAMPAAEASHERAKHGNLKFDSRGRRNLLTLSAVTILAQFSFYFFLSWLPAVMVSSFTTGASRGSGAVLLNLGGIVGGFALAGLSLRISVRRLTAATMLLAFASIGALAFCPDQGVLTAALAALVGASLFALMAGIYGIAPTVFHTLNRAGGLGIAFSVGRFGGVLSPWLGALLLRLPNVSQETSLLVMAAPLIAASAVLALLQPIVPEKPAEH